MQHNEIKNIGKNLDLSGSVRKQINFNTYVDNHHDLGYVSPAAIETEQTRHLQPIKVSIQAEYKVMILMDDKIKMLVYAYRQIYRFIYHGGKIWMNRAIQKMVRWLYHRYGMTREEIIEYLKWKFKCQRKHYKFNPEKSCLKTYVLNFTYFALLSLVRQCKNHEAGGGKEIPFSQFPNHQPIKTIGQSIDSFERMGIEGIINDENPEDILMGKQLIEMAMEHFGDSDMAVILGLKDKRAEARRLGLNYDSYRKRLQRKLNQFRQILNDNGYGLN